MRHKIKSKRLNRTSKHRSALLRNLSTSLIKSCQIKTTLAKAKFLRPYFEHLVTLAREAKTSDPARALHIRRMLIPKLFLGSSSHALDQLLGPIAESCLNRPGGYLRIVKCFNRISDNAPMAIVQLVDPIPGSE